VVLQRTIDNLRERPKHERQAVAFWISIAVVIVLIIAWGIFFIRSIDSTNLLPVNDAYSQAVQQVQTQQNQTPAPPDDTGWVSTSPQTAASDASQQQIQIIQQDSSSGTDSSAQSATGAGTDDPTQ
jgi:hypothetical protein